MGLRIVIDSPSRLLAYTGLLLVAVATQWLLARWLIAGGKPGASRGVRLGVRTLAALVSAGMLFAFLLEATELYDVLPFSGWVEWARGLSMAWALCSTVILVIAWMLRRMPEVDLSRRRLLRTAGVVLATAPAAVTAFSILTRNRFRLREIDISVPGLPKDLDGLRLVQISDIHLSPYLTETDLARAIDMANSTRAHLALVTGDLVSFRPDLLTACIRQLRKLRAEAGVLGCLGNHEIAAKCEAQATRLGLAAGIRFLRKESEILRFGNTTVNVVGVDYQRMRDPYLRGVGELHRPDSFNVLLSHNPDVFPVAAGQGFDLTLSGHTHGGQITVEILHQYLNICRFFTPYVYGLYRMGRSSIYVTRGIGTVGVPVRIGAPPEIALVRLCAT